MWAPVKGDSFEDIVSPLRHKTFSRQQKLTLGIRHLEPVVINAIQIEQDYNSFKPDVEQRSSLCKPHEGTFLFQIALRLARCRRGPCSAFIDAALVHNGDTSDDDKVPNSPVSIRPEGHPTREGQFNEAKQVEMTL